MFEMKKNEFFIQDMMLIDFMFSLEKSGMLSLEWIFDLNKTGKENFRGQYW